MVHASARSLAHNAPREPRLSASLLRERRGRGVGSALVASLLERAGGTPVFLTTVSRRAALYRRRGSCGLPRAAVPCRLPRCQAKACTHPLRRLLLPLLSRTARSSQVRVRRRASHASAALPARGIRYRPVGGVRSHPGQARPHAPPAGRRRRRERSGGAAAAARAVRAAACVCPPQLCVSWLHYMRESKTDGGECVCVKWSRVRG